MSPASTHNKRAVVARAVELPPRELTPTRRDIIAAHMAAALVGKIPTSYGSEVVKTRQSIAAGAVELADALIAALDGEEVGNG
jgi:hypothetical protein